MCETRFLSKVFYTYILAKEKSVPLLSTPSIQAHAAQFLEQNEYTGLFAE